MTSSLVTSAPDADRKRENINQLNWWMEACVLCLLCSARISVQSQTFTTLAIFDGANGDQPSSLVQGTDGNLYGTTVVGGDLSCVNVGIGCGTIFKLGLDGGIATLYSFNDAIYPVGALALGTDGNFYAVTGTIDSAGTVFRITPGGTLTTLYQFCSQPNCSDGAAPYAGLIEGTDGNFYGTTYAGGTGQPDCATGGVGSGTCGTVFRITPAGKLTTLYSFCSQANCADGNHPAAALIQGTDGNFYGSTGGASVQSVGPGTVFKITPTGKLTTLHSFCSEANCADGSRPEAMVQAANGSLYGTTYTGGAHSQGTVFKITPTGKLTILYSFCAQTGCPDGAGPGPLIQAIDGNFYGSTDGGGAFGYGTIFKITPAIKLTVLHSFNFTDGARFNYQFGTTPPVLPQATDGKFYGTAGNGGDPSCIYQGCGTAFSLDMGLPPFVSFIRASGKVGATAQILGQGFTGATSVSFNGPQANFTVKSDTYLTATVPAGASSGFVTVSTPSQTLQSNVRFRVTPQIFSISKTSGPVGTSIVITGESFSRTFAVTFGTIWATNFTIDSDTQITATVPTGAVSGKVGVEAAGGIVYSADCFIVTP